MTTTLNMCTGLLLLAGGVAQADPCKIAIEANDLMRFNVHEISVSTDCSEVEVTLKHTGQLNAKVMGHNWVLSKDSDMSAIVNAGLAAGPTRSYVPENDKRIVAATKTVGGGESTTVKFSTGALVRGSHYAFFCTSPGHAAVMHGRFVFGEVTRVAKTR
jgi:azurin